jgi:AAA family ATP:ADP antiporter
MTALGTLVRRGERREVAAAFGTIFLVMLAHALLETARDTVYLTRLPAARLPWLYLAITGFAVLVGPLLNRPGSERVNRRALVLMQLGAAAGTAVFLPLVVAPHDTTADALYIWGGVAAAVILSRFWLILGQRLTATQAKRLFPLMAAGAVAGSLSGFATAGMLATHFAPPALLGASAAAFLASAGLAALWWRLRAPLEHAEATAPAAEPMPAWRTLAPVVHHPYVRRLLLTLLLASVAVTLGDYVFKSAVAQAVPAAKLGRFLASAYFLFDLAGLVLLLVAVGPFIRLVGVPTALLVRPTVAFAASMALAFTGGLPAALALRGADGALRWSLHKTVCELLYVPMTPRLRTAVKEVSDLVAQRGGQALGSLLILGLLAAGGTGRWIALPLVLCAAAWLLLARLLRAPYRSLCRETLDDAGMATRLEFPELDLASLERLLTELSSPDDARVLAALELLAATGRTHVVPTLILYHPSAAVVVRALELFAAAGRSDWLPLAPRALRHADLAVRATAMRTYAAAQPPLDALQRLTESTCPIVASLATIAVAARGGAEPAAAVETVRAQLAAPSPPAGLDGFVARALRDTPLPAFAPLLAELASSDSPAAAEGIRALGALRDARHLPLLLPLLASRARREAVRRALLGYGDAAVTALDDALRDAALPYPVRVHVPRALSRFGHQHAADLLLAHLRVEPGGMVRYKILRGLGRMLTDAPTLHLDRDTLDAIVVSHLEKAFTLLHWIDVLEDGGAAPHGDARGLLIALLRQKLEFAIERLFRVLGLRDPSADFEQVYDSVHSDDPSTRATGHELLEQLLPSAWRGALRALTSEDPITERRGAGRGFYDPPALDVAQLLTTLRQNVDPTVAALAAAIEPWPALTPHEPPPLRAAVGHA